MENQLLLMDGVGSAPPKLAGLVCPNLGILQCKGDQLTIQTWPQGDKMKASSLTLPQGVG